MIVRVLLDVDVDPKSWAMNFGDRPDLIADIREYVRAEVEGQLQHAVDSEIRVTLGDVFSAAGIAKAADVAVAETA